MVSKAVPLLLNRRTKQYHGFINYDRLLWAGLFTNQSKMTIQEFIQKTFKEEHGYCHRPRIVCNDGFNMSVQGSAGHYCNPRKTQDWYNSLEIGYPSDEEPLINQYAETENDWTGTVYGYVPIETIQEVITKHGGVNEEETFKVTIS